MSVAEIDANGPFTALPGYRRWLAVLDDGGGLELTIGGRRSRVVTGEGVRFDGAESVSATITRPARVWNLIARDYIAWSAAWHRETSVLTLPSGVAIVHTVATGKTRIATASQPIEIAVESAPSLVVHLGLGC